MVAVKEVDDGRRGIALREELVTVDVALLDLRPRRVELRDRLRVSRRIAVIRQVARRRIGIVLAADPRAVVVIPEDDSVVRIKERGFGQPILLSCRLLPDTIIILFRILLFGRHRQQQRLKRSFIKKSFF